jgi:RecA-family ATPase
VLGSPDLFVKAGGRVLILDLEQELSDTVPRARAMSAISNQLDILDADTWEEQRRALEEQHDSDTHARMLIQAWCTKHKESAALVILDNLSLVQPVLGFHDRDTKEKAWLTKYKLLAKQYGVTIILVEHNIKANASDSAYNAVARMRGSAMKHATPNGGTFSLSYTRDKEKEKGEIQLTIEVRSAPKRLLYLKRDDTLGHHVLTISLEGLAPSEVEKATKRVHKIILDTLEKHLQLSQADITLYTGLAKSTVYQALNDLLELDQVVKLQRNLWALNLKRLRINTAAALEQSQVPALEQGRDILDAVDN